MSRAHVLITCRQMQNCFEHFRARFDERDITYELPDVVQQLSEEKLIGMIGRFDGMIAGDDPLTARVLNHAGRMRIISKWGVGTDGIDMSAAAERGIAVTNTPNVFGDEVADVMMGYLVMIARQLHRIDSSVRGGGWFKFEGITLAGKTLGIAGYGSIGQAVAVRARGFGMEVVVSDVMPEAVKQAGRDGMTILSFDEMLPRCDALALCCPLTPKTRHMLNEHTLALLPAGALIVNAARGPLIDEAALVRALDSGLVRAAALDVFEDEPLPADSQLRKFNQCVFGTHNGSNTREAGLRASAKAVDHLLDGLTT